MRPGNQDIETENPEDESKILADQDETLLSDPASLTENLGASGTEDEYGVPNAEFSRGDIDVKEQMDRTTRLMDSSFEKKRSPDDVSADFSQPH